MIGSLLNVSLGNLSGLGADGGRLDVANFPALIGVPIQLHSTSRLFLTLYGLVIEATHQIKIATSHHPTPEAAVPQASNGHH
jgi:hypothetical protein